MEGASAFPSLSLFVELLGMMGGFWGDTNDSVKIAVLISDFLAAGLHEA